MKTKAVVHNPLITAERSIFENCAAAREYSRNSASMGGIDQSHAQKVSGVTTSTHFVISRPGTWAPLS